MAATRVNTPHSLPTKTYAKADLGTAYVTMLELGVVGGPTHYDLRGALANIAALGTATTTVKFQVTVDVNGAAVAFATVDKTATGLVNLLKELGALASRYIKIEVKRNEGTGTDGSVAASFEVLQSEAQ